MLVEPSTCPICKKVFDPLRARSLIVSAGRVRAFCSDACRALAERDEAAAPPGVVDVVLATSGARGMGRWWAAAAGTLLCVLALGALRVHRARARVADVSAAAALEAATSAPFSVAEAMKVLARKEPRPGIPERDLWVHPLAGPERRLPLRASRKFRAARDHESPGECGSGHCGVDLGDRAGEWVFAAHDGVVERVVWEDVGNGGRYVRLNHRGGTLTTSYMHLGSIRPELQPGTPVKAGDPLGTLGDTGINHSGPHLHFQIGVRARPEAMETFIDPEPLLITWALRAPMAEPPPRRLARRPRPTDAGPQGM